MDLSVRKFNRTSSSLGSHETVFAPLREHDGRCLVRAPSTDFPKGRIRP